MRRPVRFNGAIDFRRRRRTSPGHARRCSPRLQWGHRLSSTETGGWSLVRRLDELWLQWCHRLSSTETRGRRPDARADRRFMGPSTFVDGDSLAPARTRRALRGFNGAIDFRRRRHTKPAPASASSSQLQWGHRLSSTETRREELHRAGGVRFNGAIDFRRRRPSRGSYPPLARWSASMGPSTFVDGHIAELTALKNQLLLQWGHRLSSTETDCIRSLPHGDM